MILDPLEFGLGYVDPYYEDETLADQMLALPARTRQFTGGRSDLLAFPPRMETLGLNVKLACLERKCCEIRLYSTQCCSCAMTLGCLLHCFWTGASTRA